MATTNRYTREPSTIVGSTDFLYNNIQATITSTTLEKRRQLKAVLDDFCTFQWRGVDAFETFGAFITNKNDLKFYNGPGFSNEYTQPQFEAAAGQLTGVKFKTQQISFTIGVYWISIEHYRQLIYWLHPYEINTLSFGFDKNHYYQVKLANISDSTRTVIGKEKVGDNIEDRYYTELKLTFEIQGTPCAYNLDEFKFSDFVVQGEDQHNYLYITIPSNDTDADIGSDLAAPVQANFNFTLGLQAQNFLRHTRNPDTVFYDIAATSWELIDSLVFDTEDNWNTNISFRFSHKNADNTLINYHGIGIRITLVNGQYNLSYLTDDSEHPTISAYSAGHWNNELYPLIQFDSNDENLNLNHVDEELCEWLIQNNSIVYLNDMKLNCTLAVGMKEDLTDPDLPSLALEPKTLFDVTLKNLTWGNPIEHQVYSFDLGYDSESGLLYMLSADSEYFLLNTLSTTAKGQRLVDSLTSNTFAITGLFNDPAFNIKNLYFILTIITYSTDGTITSKLTLTGDDTITGGDKQINYCTSLNPAHSYISIRGRTNLI